MPDGNPYGEGISSTEHNSQMERIVLEPGRYMATLTAVDPRVIPKSNPDVFYVGADFTIDSNGQQVTIIDRFFIGYDKEETILRTRKRIAMLLHSMSGWNGKDTLQVRGDEDWYQLLGLKVMLDVVIDPAQNGYPEKNKVNYYVFKEEHEAMAGEPGSYELPATDLPF